MLVHTFDELRRSPVSVLFEGRGDAVELSVFVTAFGPGRGPRPHEHPYPEVFIIEDGHARFEVAGETSDVGPGHFVVVPAETAHRFENRGEGPLRVVSIQPSGVVLQDVL